MTYLDLTVEMFHFQFTVAHLLVKFFNNPLPNSKILKKEVFLGVASGKAKLIGNKISSNSENSVE